MWYADDASAGGSLQCLCSWWDHLISLGPDFGYFPNAVKTCLIVKSQHLHRARILFRGTGVVITDVGKRHLGSALGTVEFLNSYVQNRVPLWVGEIEKLSEIAITQPQAAYTAFMYVFLHRWLYIAWIVPMSSELFLPLDDILSLHFLPAVTGQSAFGPVERELLSLPARHYGLGVIIPTDHFLSYFSFSNRVPAPLIDHLLRQCSSCSLDVYQQMYQYKHELRVSHRNDLSAQVDLLSDRLSPHLKRVLDAASERGASSLLTTLPIAGHGFALSKGEFRDAMCLRFGWQPVNLPQTCVCAKSFSVEHAFSCPCGGFPSICHNDIRDLTAKLLSEVCNDVCVEPALQPLAGEPLRYATTNGEDGA